MNWSERKANEFFWKSLKNIVKSSCEFIYAVALINSEYFKTGRLKWKQ